MTLLKKIGEIPLSARIALVVLGLNFIIILFAPMIAPYSQETLVGDVWEAPGKEFILGTDQVGRDLFSRLVYGARNTITIAIFITFVAFFVGSLLGFMATVLGGWVDELLSRTVDILMAFPTLIFALIALSILGPSTINLVIIISLLTSTRVYRLARALAMDINVLDFVEVARLRRDNIAWIMGREILPNALPPLIAEFGLRFCFVFLFISSLSFLGLGIQPPAADWGAMVRENAGAISYGIAIPLYPAACIAQLTVCTNLVVDWFLNLSSGRINDEL
ncbi:MAG: ABC transporter permease [Desulfobacterales bacterium]|nr:ABC transporter permease [Desulfobacterales bacterium]